MAGRLWASFDSLMVHSLLACQSFIMNDRHCFECYGYDILIDDDLKPWLVEVNASPSLSATTRADRVMKLALIRDVLDVVLREGTEARDRPMRGAGGFGAGVAGLVGPRRRHGRVPRRRRGRARHCVAQGDLHGE